jgi:amidase
MLNDVLFTSATHMAKLIREKQLSSEELVRAHIERIEAVNPILNAIVQLRPEQALQEARAADTALARGEQIGALHGVPFTLKDYMSIDGLKSTYGTLGFKNNVMHHDSEVTRRLKRAGGIALGLTNMPEFGASIETDSLVYGRTNNPYDLTRFPGGSTGGEGAIIAAGGSALGVGGDSGGSIREPAHYCGIAGIKPSTGRIPKTGFFMHSRGATTFKTQNGPMARYVDDLWLGLQIIAGPDGRDPTVPPVPLPDPANIDVRTLRIAFYTDNGIVACHPDVIRVVREAVAAFKDAGACVEEVAPPQVTEGLELYGKLSWANGTNRARETLKAIGTEQVSDFFTNATRNMTPDGISAAEFDDLVVAWDKYREANAEFMGKYDLIVSPTTSIPAMPHRSSITNRDIMRSYTYCATFNLLGYPAATVRCGTSNEGLPIGVQTAAYAWREDITLAGAKFLEDTFGGYQRPPL